MEIIMTRYGNDLNLKATELRLGLPGIDEQCMKHPSSGVKSKKRTLSDREDDDSGSMNNSGISDARDSNREIAPATKQQVVGWPPVRSYRKNSFSLKKNETETKTKTAGIYVKVSIDGAPYLRKIDLKVYSGYTELLTGLKDIFKFTMGHYFEREGCNGSEYEPTYQDKDGDWMLVGDVPWDMFISSCKRLRIMRASESRGLDSAGLQNTNSNKDIRIHKN